MKYRTILLIIGLWACLGFDSIPQSINLSQYFAHPLIVNPALTGSSDYRIRSGLNYRRFAANPSTNYITQSAFVDTRFDYQSNGITSLGLGLILLGDKAGDGNLQSVEGAFSVSMRYKLNNRLFLGWGGNIKLINRSLEVLNLNFADQWQGNGFMPGSSQENFSGHSMFYADVDLGFVLDYSLQRKTNNHLFSDIDNTFHLGVTVNNLGYRNIQLLEEDVYADFYQESKKRALSFQFWYTGKLNRTAYFKPEFFAFIRGVDTEYVAGINVAQKIARRYFFHLGLWSRFGEDIIPSVGYENPYMKILMTYDVSIAAEELAPGLRGGMELSITFYTDSRKPLNFLTRKNFGKLHLSRRKYSDCPKY